MPEPEPKHEYVLRLVIEDITYIATKVSARRVEDPSFDELSWEIEETLEMQEHSREVIQSHEIMRNNLATLEYTFEEAVERVTTPRLTRKQVEGGRAAIRYGLEQPEAAELKEMIKNLKPLTKSLIVSEIVHSLNRKGMIPNESVEKLIHELLGKEEDT